MKIINSKIFLFLVTLLFAFTACEDEFDLPYNEVIPPEQSGLPGFWEVVSVQKEFAKTLQDSLGNTINDDKNRPLWRDTTVLVTASENGYNEFIQFYTAEGINSFAASNLDSLNTETGNLVPADEMLNMPVTSGQWTALITIDPSGENEDIQTVSLFDPENTHNPLASVIWTIKKVEDQELVIEYSFGPQSYDTLFIKTFQKR